MNIINKVICSIVYSGILLISMGAGFADAQSDRFTLENVFDLEYASDPRISPDGSQVVFVRNFMDKMADSRRSNLWIVNSDGTDLRALTSGTRNDFSPRWSPDGTQLIYASSVSGSVEIYRRWMDTGQTAQLTRLEEAPSNIAWSPDGRWIAFTMFVPKPQQPFVSLPAPPDGADWGPPFGVFDQLRYRANGQGYLEKGFHHIFLVPVEGGSPRQLTTGEYEHENQLSWTSDGESLVYAAYPSTNDAEDTWQTDIFKLHIPTGKVETLTDQPGPETNPVVSPDGTQIAYLRTNDYTKGYEFPDVYLMNADGSNHRNLTGEFDRGVYQPQWDGENRGLYVKYDDQGNGKVGYVNMKGAVQTLAENVGGVTIGRPYQSGSFSVATDGTIAFTQTSPHHPADVAITSNQANSNRLTRLNKDILDYRTLGEVEEFRFKSTFDDRDIHGWIVTPPGFQPDSIYPLILEIHGGPYLNYGDRFSAEIQLYASRGYVVVYINSRGSSSYGKEFMDLIHQKFPLNSLDDFLSGVDYVIDQGYIDPVRLYVTGGSGGGWLTSWIVGHTDRFRAAVALKPLINAYSISGTGDIPWATKYWFPDYPWNDADHYMDRSPISHVGNVTTPTMIITGEEDYRTPISESEQFYQALQFQKVESMLVRIPDASHSISAKPSNLMGKVAYVLEWFERHGGSE